MFSSSLRFCFRGLVVLFTISFCFPKAVDAQSTVQHFVQLPIQTFVPSGFVVYGRAPTAKEAGIVDTVTYQQISDPFPTITDPLPNLVDFFEFGGTLELITTYTLLGEYDIAISEIMWGVDARYPLEGDPTYAQWIELCNTSPNTQFAPQLFLLLTPFESYPDRHRVDLPNGEVGIVLDAVSNLHLGKWNLPGRSGSSPFSNVVSAYRDIAYVGEENPNIGRAIVPFGSYKDSWKATPVQGRRNTLLSVVNAIDRVVELPYVATPGTQHVSDTFLRSVPKTVVPANRVVINEVRNDLSEANFDWIELKNVSRAAINLGTWELSLVTAVGADTDLVDLPDYTLLPGEILLLCGLHPQQTPFAGGINIENPDRPKTKGAIHKYFIVPGLNLPNTGKFVLLLRSEPDKNGQDAAIADYAGDGFFSDTPYTDFWPRAGQPRPTDVANFGNIGSFTVFGAAWARIRYQPDDGHHKDAWARVGTQGGVGYAPNTDRTIAIGTPGYENDALKTRIDDGNSRTPALPGEYSDGEISISEIMVDTGMRGSYPQWIELHNSSRTEAINLEGWEFEIRNLKDGPVFYTNGRFFFKNVTLLPNQTLLLVSSNRAPTNVIENRIYDLYKEHRRELRLSNRQSSLLNPMGFSLKLTDTRGTRMLSDDIVIDRVGNIRIETGELTKVWDLPPINPEVRLSLLRQYTQTRGVLLASVGTLQEAWQQAHPAFTRITYYGDVQDVGTPGYRVGGPLPVALTRFKAARSESGGIVVHWTTASELNNAGFNLLRSETRDGGFVVINPQLIPGAGTSGERHEYQFTDTTAAPDTAYYYRIEDISFGGVRQTLATVRLKGFISATGKLKTRWGELKRWN